MNARVALFSACLPGLDARQVVDIARALGFGAIEWGTGPDQAITDPQSAGEIRALCGDAGLGCSGVAVQDERVTLAAPDLGVAAVDLAVALGAPHVRVRAPGYCGESLRHQRKLIRDGLGILVERASPHGLAVLVETSPGTLAPTPESAVALIEGHSPAEAGVLYDPGNMIIEGHVEPRLAIACLDEYLTHVHVKNVAWQRSDGTWNWRYAPVMGGLADWSTILGALAAAGYLRRFSIDHLPGPPTESLLREEGETLSGLIDSAFFATASRAGRPATSEG
jgi:sugar phosphate isomerase/epimerase